MSFVLANPDCPLVITPTQSSVFVDGKAVNRLGDISVLCAAAATPVPLGSNDCEPTVLVEGKPIGSRGQPQQYTVYAGGS